VLAEPSTETQTETQTQTLLPATATVTSKGQITLPVALRNALNIQPGTKIVFELKGTQFTGRPELPISAYRGILKPYAHLFTDTEIPKEPDREFD
jgi:AbrB family looped-hinge helix DNA binding protein